MRDTKEWISSFDLTKATHITPFEKFCLWFINRKYQVDEQEGSTLVYKIFRGKVYILDEWINPPKGYNCRCVVIPKNS